MGVDGESALRISGEVEVRHQESIYDAPFVAYWIYGRGARVPRKLVLLRRRHQEQLALVLATSGRSPFGDGHAR